MLTSLYIEKPQDSSIKTKVCRLLQKDKIETYYKQLGNIKIKCIDYTQYSKDVKWHFLDKSIGAQRNHLLCSKEVQLPLSLGYKRFCDFEYQARLCTNLAVALVSSAENENLSVGIVDLKGELAPVTRYILKHTDKVVVVTENVSLYKDVADGLLSETGAILRLSKTTKSLRDCSLVVAPIGIDTFEDINENALLLTTKKPKNSLKCAMVYDYKIKLPKALCELCPRGLDRTYFASALYSVCNMYELGSLVPRICVSRDGTHTLESLKTLLNNIASKT